MRENSGTLLQKCYRYFVQKLWWNVLGRGGVAARLRFARFGKGAIKGGKSTLSILFLLFIFLRGFRDLEILLLRLKYVRPILFDASKLSGCFNQDWIKLEDFVVVFLAIISNWNWSDTSCFGAKLWAKIIVWSCWKNNVLNFVLRSVGKIENPWIVFDDCLV